MGIRGTAVLLAVLATVASGCSPSSPTTAQSSPGGAKNVQLSVLAGVSLAAPFKQIASDYESSKGVHVDLNLSTGSAHLAQLGSGLQADVFAVADEGDMQKAIDRGLVQEGVARVFASNHLIVIMSTASRGKLQTLRDLGRPGTRLIFGSAATAVGRSTQEFLKRAAAETQYGPGFVAGVRANVVSEEASVKAITTKIELGQADAGIVFVSETKANTASRNIGVLEIPANLNVMSRYVIAVLKRSKQGVAAQAFVDYVLSKDPQARLKAAGFEPASVGVSAAPNS